MLNPGWLSFWSLGINRFMWTCPKCQESLEDQFGACWKCAGRRDGIESAGPPAQASPGSPPAVSSGGGTAFVKGGCGCLVIFVVLALLTVALGGHAHADLGGLIFLFVMGGIIGLIVFFVYNKGRKDASISEHSKKDDHDA
jgi:hypothetical protein